MKTLTDADLLDFMEKRQIQVLANGKDYYTASFKGSIPWVIPYVCIESTQKTIREALQALAEELERLSMPTSREGEKL